MPAGLDLLLIYPNNRVRAYGSLGETVAGVTPPIQVGLLAACAQREGLTVRVLDTDAENLSLPDTVARVQSMSPRLICVSTDHLNSGDVTKMAAASETVAALKKSMPSVPVVLEGVVPSAFPEEVLRKEGADFVCQGEPYQPVAALAKSLKAGKAPEPGSIAGLWTLRGDSVAPAPRAPMVDPDNMPTIPWGLFPMERYRAHHWHCFDNLEARQPYACIYTNMGCPYPCSFCNVNVVFGKPNFRARSPVRVIEDIDILVRKFNVRNIRIVDNVFTIKPELVDELCHRIIRNGYDLNLWAYARVETMQEAALIKKMRKAGVRWICYGIEAGTQDVRRNVLKGSSEQVIDRAIELTREAGIHVLGNYIFGLPGDTLAGMRATLEAAKKYNAEWANFYCAMAYPGTELHAQAVKKGVRLPENWEGYGQYSENILPLPTETLKPVEILQFRDEAFREYFDRPAYRERIGKLFGEPAVNFVKDILQHKLPRKLVA